MTDKGHKILYITAVYLLFYSNYIDITAVIKTFIFLRATNVLPLYRLNDRPDSSVYEMQFRLNKFVCIT